MSKVKRIKQAFLPILLVVLMVLGMIAPTMLNPAKVHANSKINKKVVIRKVGRVYAYGTDGLPVQGLNASAIFTSTTNDAHTAFCGMAGVASGLADGSSRTYNEVEIVSNQKIRKSLYYGWKGPKQWKGFSKYADKYKYKDGGVGSSKLEVAGVCITSMVLSDAYGKSPYSYNMAGKNAFNRFLEDKPNPPSKFIVYLCPGPGSTQDLFTWEMEKKGALNLKKAIADNQDIVNAFPDSYSLAGAEYGVYTSPSASGASRVATLKTNASGVSNTVRLEPGKYYVKEIKAPKGYSLDKKLYSVDIRTEKTVTIKVSDSPKVAHVKLKKETKHSAHLTKLCPEQYSLVGAEYRLSEDEGCEQVIATFKTDQDGNSNTVKVAPGTYFIRETKAPRGYKLDNKIYRLSVSAGKTTTFKAKDSPLFDPLELTIKKHIKGGSDQNLSVEGAEYAVKYYKQYLTEDQVKKAKPFRTWIFKTDNKGDIRLGDPWKVRGDDLFKNEDGKAVGLLGTYTVEEVKAPKGLAKTEGIISFQHVKSTSDFNGVTVLKDVEDIENPQTVSISLQKIDGETEVAEAQGYGSLEGALYQVFYYDPLKTEDIKVGEIITDKKGKGSITGLKPGIYTIKEKTPSKGYILDDEIFKIQARIKEFDTANFDYPVKSKEFPTTVEISKIDLSSDKPIEGAKLELYNSKGDLIEAWTSSTDPHIIKGLTVGETYRIKEVQAPDGYFLNEDDLIFTVKGTKELQKVIFKNEPKPVIKTKALTDEGIDDANATKEVTIIDTVSYDKVIPGKEYTIKGKLVNKSDANDIIADAKKTFTPDKAQGTVDIEFIFDGSKLEGETVVVLEELYKDKIQRAIHADINDENQAIKFPKLRTKAEDIIDEGKEIMADEKQTIVDHVFYSNLQPGKEYTVSGHLINKDTGKAIVIDGEKLISSKTFKPVKEEGVVDLEFTFDASLLVGQTLVVFEDLYRENIKVGSHADINDEEQTLYLPQIGTFLVSEDGGKSVLPTKEVKLIDKISYNNLEIDQVYMMKGRLIRKSDKTVLTEEEKIFKPDDLSGEIKIEFTVDTSQLRGSDIVCFETLYLLNKDEEIVKPVAKHETLEDEGQTIKVTEPDIKTKASNVSDKKDIENSIIKIKDVVTYNNLIPGKNCTLSGKLMDKETGKVILNKKGEPVTVEMNFTPDKSNGELTMEFSVDYESVKGKTTVVFENLYIDDVELANHADLADKDQTVEIKNPPIPKLKTNKPDTGDYMAKRLIFFMTIFVLSSVLIRQRKKRMDKN